MDGWEKCFVLAMISGASIASILLTAITCQAVQDCTILALGFWGAIPLLVIACYLAQRFRRKAPRQPSLRVLSRAGEEVYRFSGSIPQIRSANSVSTSSGGGRKSVKSPRARPSSLAGTSAAAAARESGQSSSTLNSSGTFNFNERSRAYPGAAPFDPKVRDSPIAYISSPERKVACWSNV